MKLEMALVFVALYGVWTEYGKEAWETLLAVVEAGDLAVDYASSNMLNSKEAWETLLAVVEAGDLAVDYASSNMLNSKASLLHFAASLGSAGVVRRLLELGASPWARDVNGYLPMHFAAGSCCEALEKCQMLPVAGLGCHASGFGTPLHMCAASLCYWLSRPFYGGYPGEDLLNLLQWMLQQFECCVLDCDDDGRTAAFMFSDIPEYPRPLAMVRAAEAMWARWTPARAAWLGAVAV